LGIWEFGTLAINYFFKKKSLTYNINMSQVDSSAQTFYVNTLNIQIDASKALLPDISFSFLDFISDVNATFDVSLNVVKNLFLYQSDAIDVNDLIEEDIKFKLNFDSSGTTPAYQETWSTEAIQFNSFIQDTYCTGSDVNDVVYINNTANALKKTVADDYLRFLALRLFRTAMGVDLFSNEQDVKDNLNASAKQLFVNRMKAISELNNGEFLDASACENIIVGSTVGQHPTYSIFNQIMSNTPERFYDMSDNIWNVEDASFSDASLNDTELPIYMVPVRVGDKIMFELRILSHPDQADVVTVTNLTSTDVNFTTINAVTPANGDQIAANTRYYKIMMNVV
jgi:hypothetical protein